MTSFLKRVQLILLYAHLNKIVKKNKEVFDRLAKS